MLEIFNEFFLFLYEDHIVFVGASALAFLLGPIMCSTLTSISAALVLQFLAAGLCIGCLTGVWASDPSLAGSCYLTRSISPAGVSTSYDITYSLSGGELSQAGQAASSFFTSALGAFTLAFAVTLARGAHLQDLWCCDCSSPTLAPLALARQAASHWAASLLPSLLGVLCLALGTAAGWVVVHKCPCAGGSLGASPTSSAIALCCGGLALVADACSHFFPAPERSPMDDNTSGYVSLPAAGSNR